MEAGKNANISLKRRLRLEEHLYDKDLDELILQTSKTSALRAVNLNELLKKKWSEEKNAYRLMSKINSDKQDRRIKYILKKDFFWIFTIDLIELTIDANKNK